jgi:hypothetical protein
MILAKVSQFIVSENDFPLKISDSSQKFFNKRKINFTVGSK